MLLLGSEVAAPTIDLATPTVVQTRLQGAQSEGVRGTRRDARRTAVAGVGAIPISLAICARQWYACRVREQRERGTQQRLPVSLILLVSMTAAGVVYPVTDSALHHTSPIMIATLRAIVAGCS